MDTITMVIDDDTLSAYHNYYFTLHPRAHKAPIKAPYHESINQWMIMKRPVMNALKQRWKEFIMWFVEREGYSNLHIEKCEIEQSVYYPNRRRHDVDNSVPKFILDGLVESGMIVDDDSSHLCKLSLQCDVDKEYPRTELNIKIIEYKEDSANGWKS